MTVRTLTLLLALGAGVALADGAKEAQALFEAMEAKLTAKTLQVRFVSTQVTGKKQERWECRGVLRLGSKGQALMVCWDEAGKVQAREWSLIEFVAADFRRALTRLSIRARSEYLLPKEGAKLPAESFVLGPAVEEGGKTLRVVEFDTRSTVAGAVHVKVWIDTASKLPVRRELKSEDGDTFRESYTSIELDPDLGPDAFAEDAQPDPVGSQ